MEADLVKAAVSPSASTVTLRQDLADAGRRLDTLNARIAKDFPAYGELSNPKPLRAEAAQALLASDEALLVYLATDQATWLWVLRRDKIALYRIETGAKALAREVKSLRERLDPELNKNLAPFPAARAYALYQRIVSPAEPLLAGVRHLLIVPDGALQSLPLGVLVTQPSEHDPKTLADHRDIAWLARDYAVTVLPSLSALQGLPQSATSEHPSAPFLGVGNPVLTGSLSNMKPTLVSLFGGAVADADKVRVLPPLPETADELRGIAEKLGATEGDLLLGERASEPMLRRIPLDRYRVVAFATHGLMSGELILISGEPRSLAEPALVLTPPAEATADNDGLLTASKIAILKFNADWVVLSACNTARGDGSSDAGELSGLAKAFFYAGARSLLVSHWPVRSNAAVQLTTDAFAELAKDPTIGRAEALRRSMMVMLDPSKPPEFAHPLAWAPFVLAGEGGAGR
jgi:CHAT domain-containing protein